MKLILMIWFMNILTLEAVQIEYKGSRLDCEVMADMIMEQSDDYYQAGCYVINKTPPWGRAR